MREHGDIVLYNNMKTMDTFSSTRTNGKTLAS
jgi:hypothetical protein